MKFINLLGKTEDFDYAVDNYISGEEIQLEFAMQEMKNIRELRAMEFENRFAPLAERARKVFANVAPVETDMDAGEAERVLTGYIDTYEDAEREKKKYCDELAKLYDEKNILSPFCRLDFDLKKIKNFEFVHVRFGKMPRDINGIERILVPYEKNENTRIAKFYLLDKEKNGKNIAVFIPSFWDKAFIWGIYFSPSQKKPEVDSIFASLHFERRFVPDEVLGNPMEEYSEIEKMIAETELKLKKVDEKLERFLKENGGNIGRALYTVLKKAKLVDVRKYAAESKWFFYIVGWMKKEDAERLSQKAEKDKKVTFIVEDESNAIATKPPTVLRNPSVFRPFEMYLKLYGLPSYKDVDPTVFLAISFTLLFGIMFGDVGQGLVLLIAGLFLYKTKGSSLGGIIALCAVSSIAFGFLYGSIFGNEEILPAVWLRPSHDIMRILIVTVAIGAVLELFVILLNTIISFRKRDYANAVCSQNALAGFLFYLTVILAVLSAFTGGWMKKSVTVPIIAVTLVLIFLREPIERKIKGEKVLEEKLGIFIVQSFFELFEILLGYITNTISFVRVGAFALSHAGMMTVVGILMDMAGRGSVGYYAAFILGNAVVIGLEGLIVSIQVLRLEFYELFGRFFAGGGREFEPYNKIV